MGLLDIFSFDSNFIDREVRKIAYKAKDIAEYLCLLDENYISYFEYNTAYYEELFLLCCIEAVKLINNKYDNNTTAVLPCVGLADIIENGDMRLVREYLQNNIAQYKTQILEVLETKKNETIIQDCKGKKYPIKISTLLNMVKSIEKAQIPFYTASSYQTTDENKNET